MVGPGAGEGDGHSSRPEGQRAEAAPTRDLDARRQVVYEDCSMVNLTAPYMSGFLAFREVPFLVDAVQRLREKEPHMVPQAGTPTARRALGSAQEGRPPRAASPTARGDL